MKCDVLHKAWLVSQSHPCKPLATEFHGQSKCDKANNQDLSDYLKWFCVTSDLSDGSGLETKLLNCK